MVNRVAATALMLAFLSPVMLLAESGGAAGPMAPPGEELGDLSDERPRRLAVFVGGDGHDLAFAESLLAAVARSRDDLVVRRGEEWRDDLAAEGLPADDELAAAARMLNTDAWLRLVLDLDGDALAVDFVVEDLLTGVRRSGSYRTPSGQIREFQHRAWVPILDAIESVVVAREEAGTLRVRGEPGTAVRVDDEPARGIPESGEITYTLPVPGTYRIRAVRPGSWPAEERVVLEAHRELDFFLDPAPRFAGQFSLYNAQFPELGVMFFPGRRSFFLGAGVTSFALGYALRDVRDPGEGEPTGVAVSLPLTSLSLSAGGFFGGPEQQTRAYLGVQPFVRVTHYDGLGLEPFAPLGVSAQLGLEYRPFRRGGLFLEWLPTAYPTPRVDELLEYSRRTGGTLAVGTGHVYAELLLVRLGYRHYFSVPSGR